MRGEHDPRLSRHVSLMGSSPHARGTRGFVGREVRDFGIIPACAGNTRRRIDHHQGDADHPRMRGEHTKKIA